MDILDDMGVSNLSAKVFSKVNYPFKYLDSVLPPPLVKRLKAGLEHAPLKSKGCQF